MRGFAGSLARIAAIAVLTWVLGLVALPRVIMRTAMSRIRGQAIAEAQGAGKDGAAPAQGASGQGVPDGDHATAASRILARDAWNVALAAPPTTAESRTIVRPSPDLLYVACVYDLASGPVLVQAPHSPTYLSLSAFADNTDNFFAMNDRGPEGAGGVALLLLPPGTPDPQPDVAPGARRVASPSRRGIVLARLRIDRPGQLAELLALQAQVGCTPVR